jgi:hypothetical protein
MYLMLMIYILVYNKKKHHNILMSIVKHFPTLGKCGWCKTKKRVPLGLLMQINWMPSFLKGHWSKFWEIEKKSQNTATRQYNDMAQRLTSHIEADWGLLDLFWIMRCCLFYRYMAFAVYLIISNGGSTNFQGSACEAWSHWTWGRSSNKLLHSENDTLSTWHLFLVRRPRNNSYRRSLRW